MTMIKAVLFDWGNVLNSHDGLNAKLANFIGVSEQKFQEAVPKSIHDWHTGLPEEIWWERMAKESGGVYRGGLYWREAFEAVVKINNGLFSVVKKLRNEGYKTAMITNAEMPNMQYIQERIVGSKYNAFDVYVYSCSPEVKEAKPKPKIYQIGLDKLQVSPGEALLVDDVEENVGGFRNMGGHGIVHKNNHQTMQELSRILGVFF